MLARTSFRQRGKGSVEAADPPPDRCFTMGHDSFDVHAGERRDQPGSCRGPVMRARHDPTSARDPASLASEDDTSRTRSLWPHLILFFGV